MTIKDEIVARISSFPTLPMMVHRLMQVANDTKADTAQVGTTIGYDPALTANVLKAANSAYLGYAKSVNSLSEAVLRLGTKWVLQIAFSSLVYSNIRKPAEGYELTAEDQWRHATAVALMSDHLVRLLDLPDSGLVYTAGLVHDIGKIALSEFVGDSYDEISETANKQTLSFAEAEREVLGVDHAQVGGMVAEHWNFPDSIVQIIRQHHDPDAVNDPSPLLDAVHIADAVCLMEGFGLGREGLRYRPSDAAIDRLKITTEILESVTSQLLDSLNEIERLFKETTDTEKEGSTLSHGV